MVRTVVLMMLIVVSVTTTSCKKLRPGSSLDDLATANSLKTGFFLPKLENQYANTNSSVREDAVSFAKRHGITPMQGAKYTLTRNGAGEILLLLQTKTHEPMPVISVDSSGIKYFWQMQTAGEKDTLFLSDIWIKTKSGEKVAPQVSSDGNSSNMYIVRRPETSAGISEPMLVSWVDHLETSSNATLFRVGNSIVAVETNTAAYDFLEIGHQVWQLRGVYRDADVQDGSVFWSADLITYYSLTPGRDVVTEWRKQDKDSMDRVGNKPKSSVTVPSIVQNSASQTLALSEQDILHPASGLSGGVMDRAHFYLYPYAGAGASAMQLVEKVAPDLDATQAEVDAFFDPNYSDTPVEAKKLNLADAAIDANAIYRPSANGTEVDHVAALQVPYNKLPKLSFNRQGAGSGEGSYRYDVATKAVAGGLPASISTGRHFSMQHAGKNYRAVVVVPPYSTLETITRPEDRWYSWNKTRTIDERVQHVKVQMVPVDTNGDVLPNATPQLATIDGFRGGVSQIQTMASVTAEAQRAADELDPANVNSSYNRYVQQSRNIASTARADMVESDAQYSDMTTVNGLAKRATGEIVGAGANKLGSVYEAGLTKASAKTFGRAASMAGASASTRDAVVKYGAGILVNVPASQAANVLEGEIDALSGGQRKTWSSAAGVAAATVIPGVGEGSAAYRKAGIKVATSLAKREASQQIQGSNGGATSWTNEGMNWASTAADVGLDVLNKSPVTAIPVALGRYAKDEAVLIAKYAHTNKQFQASSTAASKALNVHMRAMSNDPDIISDQQAKISSALKKVPKKPAASSAKPTTTSPSTSTKK